MEWQVLLTTPLALPICAGDGANSNAATAMERYLARPTITHPYSASRRLEVSGSGQCGWLDVRSAFTPRVDSSTKCAFKADRGIYGAVLRSLLDQEQDQIARGTYRYSHVDDRRSTRRRIGCWYSMQSGVRFREVGICELGETRTAFALSEAASGRNLDRRLRHGVLRRSRLVSIGRGRGGSTDGLWSCYGNVHRPHDFSSGDFQLCGDRDFLGPFYMRHTPSGELSGTEAGQNGELERVEIRGTLHHMRLPFLRTAGRGRFGFIERTTGRKRR